MIGYFIKIVLDLIDIFIGFFVIFVKFGYYIKIKIK